MSFRLIKSLETAALPVVALILSACATAPGDVASAARTSPPAACSAPALNPGAPPARANAAFAFDIDHQVMVLFGGGTDGYVGGISSLSDTWTWNGQGWTQEHPVHSPPGVAHAAMAYDFTHHQMVLFVPEQGPGTAVQTWTWDGRDWTQQHPVRTPPSRIEPAMATDPSRNGVVLVGGTDSSDRSDVWAWSGVDWTEVKPNDQGTVFGAAHAVVVSPKGNGLLMVVGNLGAYELVDRVWTSLGLPWPGQTGYVGNITYAVGGSEPLGFVRFGPNGETWTWLPGRDPAWQMLTPPCSPPARWANAFRPAMAYDGWRGVVVIFGGVNRNDTWTFDGRSWAPAKGGAAPPATPSPVPSTDAGAWSSLPGLPIGRLDHTATVLRDGRVLVVGGSQEAEVNPAATVVIFDPTTNTWSAAASMASPRARHTATLLTDGRVLVVGGLGPGRGTAELYDPATNSWSPAGNLVEARANHEAVLLGDGSVLVIGGRQPGRPLASAEIFDPRTRSWTAVAALSVARDRPVAVTLRDGRVLVTGGVTVDVGGALDAAVLFGKPLATTELYDPVKKAWTAGASLSVGRVGHAMAILADGKVLVVGGTRDPAPGEIYDPVADAWSTTSELPPRIAPAAGVLKDGRVIVAGGLEDKYDPTTVASTGYNPVLLESAMVFDPAVHQWTAVASLGAARWLATGSVLPDGRFLVCGGGNPLAYGSDAVEAFARK